MNAYIVSVVLLCFFPATSCSPTVRDRPQEADWVMDEPDLLSGDQEDSIAALAKGLESSIGSQVAVLIVDSLRAESIEVFSLRKANELQLGRASHNDGVLITVALSDRKIRIDVGTGLEKIITNDIATRLINEDIAPRFARHQYKEGLYAAVEKIADLIKQNKETIGQ